MASWSLRLGLVRLGSQLQLPINILPFLRPLLLPLSF